MQSLIIVANIANVLGISESPALIISERPIDIERTSASGTKVLKEGAIDRLIEQGKLQDLLFNLPIWAARGNFSSKVKFGDVRSPYSARSGIRSRSWFSSTFNSRRRLTGPAQYRASP